MPTPASTYDQAAHLTETVTREVLPKTEPGRDPYGAYWLHRQDLGRAFVMRAGRVVDYVSYANAYKVQVEYNHTVWTTPMVQTSLQAAGARQLNTYAVGSWVLVCWSPFTSHAWLLGCLPDFMTDATRSLSDTIVQAGCSGQRADAAHYYHTDLDPFGVIDWSAGRPRDSTSAGEWGAINEHGMRVFLDGYMAALAADECTGVWAFYRDQMLRVAGHNFQLRTSLRERDDVDDQDELSSYQSLSPYSWERMGTFFRGPAVVREENPEASADTYAKLEPAYDDQQPFGRLIEFEGYLGQLRKTMVLLPPEVAPEDTAYDTVLHYGEQRDLDAVFDQTIAMNGAYSLRSAKRVLIRKRPSIPGPKQVWRPADPPGDNPANYRHAGHSALGAGPPHLLVGQPAVPSGAEEECTVRAASAFDLGAFVFNWEGMHQFYYHHADWYLPDEGTTFRLDVVQELLPFDWLQTDQYLEAPTPEEAVVDHRSKAKYWPNESGLDLLDDGGVLLYDGFGSEIRMTGGQVFISAPGDIFLQAGRNVNCMAGRDFIARAAWCVDLSATCRDVRIKAENNLLMLGGNNECGGVVIESKAYCPTYNYDSGEDAVYSGITLKAPDSYISFHGKNILNHVVADEDGNGGVIRTTAGYFERFIGNAAFDFFVDLETCEVNGVNEYWPEHTALGTNLSVAGRTDLSACLRVNDWISVNGHIATLLAGEYSGLVNALTDEAYDTLTDGFSYLEDRLDYVYGVAYDECQFSGVGESGPDFEQIGFSFRTDEQYGTWDFYLYESRWQQIARLSPAGPPARWTETGVTGPDGEEEYPYPGRDAWTGYSGWRTITPHMYNVVDGASAPRGPIYETARYGVTTKQALDGNYPIVG